MGPVPLPDIAGPGNSTGGGPDGGMPGGRRNPAFYLSPPPLLLPPILSLSLGLRVNLPPRAQPQWRGGPAPESAGLRSMPKEAGLASQSSPSVHFPPLSPRPSLDPLPATRAAGTSGPACWHCRDPGHFIDRCPVMDVGTLIRVLDTPQAAPDQADMYQKAVGIKGVLIGLWWIQVVIKPRSIKA